MPLDDSPNDDLALDSAGLFRQTWQFWFQSIKSAFTSVDKQTDAIESRIEGLEGVSPSGYLNIQQTGEQSPDEDTGIIWLANGAGTQNGQAYGQGDIVFTGNVGGTEKTIVIVDWDAV